MKRSPREQPARALRAAALLHVLTLACWLLSPVPAAAQAWVTPAGQGSVSLFHQFVRSDEHIDRVGGGTRALGSETFHIAALEVSYGAGERVSVEGTLVWAATRWSGDEHNRHGPLDTGTYHAALQDARVAVHYQLSLRPLAVAPFVAIGTPTHAYETRGHSAFGRNLRDLQIGLSLGREIPGPAGPGYVHASAAYSISERVAYTGLNLNRFNGDAEVGVPLARRAAVRGFGNWQVMRDGLELGPQTEHLHLSPVHDRLARSSYLQAGGGATFALGQDLHLSVTGFATVTGRNVHAVRALVTGLTWSFGGRFGIDPPSSGPR